jgi:large subunit ribosomal protein L9
MKVIILEDDRVENVSDGYARNFLFPRKLAMIATKAAMAAVAKRQEKKKAEVAKRQDEMKALAEQLSALEVVVTADVGEGGKLFGSITSSDLIKAIKQAANIVIDKRKILLNEPIKAVGDYTVNIKLFQDISAAVKVKVAAK